ncbi:MAG: hypothetical protein AABM30_12985 [Actinomycetota bacterium]
MKTPRKLLLVGGAVLVLAAGLAGVGRAVGGGDDQNVTGPAADRARAAAIAIVPGGKVNAVERDSEKGATWEVEVARPDGKTVDVRLDAAYRQVAVDGDTEESGEQSGDTD